MSKDSSFKQNLSLLPVNFKAAMVVLLTVLLFFVAQFVGVLLLFIFLSLFGVHFSDLEHLLTDNIYIQFLSILLIEVVTLYLISLVLRVNGKPFWLSLGLGKKPELESLGIAAGTYFLYFGAFLVIAGLVSWLVPAVDIDQAQQLGFESPEGVELIVVYLSLVVLPAFVEEVLFRGFLFQRLRALIKIGPAAIITSVIFAVAHLEFLSGSPLNWIAAIDTFVFSLFLILLLVKTKSLWASIFLHAIKNSVAFIFLFIVSN